MKTKALLLILIASLAIGKSQWGWNSHRYINYHAVQHLPAEMGFWLDQQNYLHDHAVDPDTDSNPGYYHYIDIDYYPEFFQGTLPHTWDEIVALYGESTVIQQGIIPWVIVEWTDSLTNLMTRGEWDHAWQIAAELGHYAADSHQPMHLTLNYNGQLTGNYGIHSRYETQLINPYLGLLPPAVGQAEYWESILDSVFNYIEAIYPAVDSIIATDDVAKAQDPDYGATYYDTMWRSLGEITTDIVHMSTLDLASIWYTAWIDAGSPNPSSGVSLHHVRTPGDYTLEFHPNPANPSSTVQFTLPTHSHVTLTLYDLKGRAVGTILDEYLRAGSHEIRWGNLDHRGISLGTGVYLCQLSAGNFSKNTKLLYLK